MSSITREAVLKMPLADILAAVKAPETSEQMQQLLRDRQVVSRVSQLMLERQNQEAEVDRQLALNNPPSTEELAAQAAAAAAEATPPVEAAPVPPTAAAPDFTEEDAAWKTEGVVVTRDAGKITRMVQEYQVRDEDGSPIGRPTHLEARTPYELLSKQRVAHENATRAFHRLKKQKTSFKQTEENRLLTPAEITAAAAKALEAKDAAEAEKIVRSVIENDFKQREVELVNAREHAEGTKIGNIFIRRHIHDFNPNEANLKALGEYLRDHQMEFTLDNLEVAFADLQEQGDKLAAVEVRASAAATRPADPANTPGTATVPAAAAPELPATPPAVPVTPPAVAPPAAASSQPTVEATETTPAAAHNAQPAARRPGVNGSIPPGTMSAHRPGAPDPALARKEFMKQLRDMKPNEIRTKLKNDPQFVKQLETYGVKVR